VLNIILANESVKSAILAAVAVLSILIHATTCADDDSLEGDGDGEERK